MSAYGRPGLGSFSNSSSGSLDYAKETVLIGAGAELATPKGFGQRADATIYDADAQLMQIALLYRFGSTADRESGPLLEAALPITPEPPVKTVPATPIKPVGRLPTTRLTANGCATDRDLLAGVHFEPGSSTLDPSSWLELARVTRLLKSAAAYFSETGIALDRIQTSRYTQNRPVADSSTAAGRACNRRVEISEIVR